MTFTQSLVRVVFKKAVFGSINQKSYIGVPVLDFLTMGRFLRKIKKVAVVSLGYNNHQVLPENVVF